MDRLTEKLTLAAGVNQRVAKSIEDDADALIAREHDIMERKDQAFKPHHQALDDRQAELNRFEDSLQILENASPLKGGGDTEREKVDKLLEKAVGDAVALAQSAPLQSGSTASIEPGQ